MGLTGYDLMRIRECYTCPYSDPEDDTDGKCLTKKKYQGYGHSR